jgi:hypothetical protein
MTEFSFDPTTEEGSSLVPGGVYFAEITDASIADTKNGKGCQLHLTWTIRGGEHENRCVWQSLMFAHTESPVAVKIGRQQIKDICDATNITESITDPDIFVGKLANIRVGIQADKTGAYPDRNSVLRVSKPGKPTPKPAPTTATHKVYEPLKPVAGGKADKDLNDSVPF